MVYIQYDNLVQFYTMHRGYYEVTSNLLRSVSSGRKIFHKNHWYAKYSAKETLVRKSPAEAGPCGLLGNFYFAYVYSFGITSIKSGEQSLNDYLIDATAYA